MSYPRQLSVLARLESKAHSDMLKIEDEGVRKMQRLWDKTKSALRAAVMTEYRQDFPRQTWDKNSALNRGTFIRIERAVKQNIDAFNAAILNHADKFLAQIYRERALRTAWILDQVTPPNVKIRIPLDNRMREAMVNSYVGDAARIKWQERWFTWTDAYRSNLQHNLMLGALNESSLSDAADEIDATRVGSPAFDLWDVMDRLFRSEAIASSAEASSDIVDANDDMDITEVWQTVEDGRVCEICDPNNGLERDEADDDIPAHPWCRCFWRTVPKTWADLQDREYAQKLDEEGVVPDAMVIWDEKDEKPMAAVILDFNVWRKGMSPTIQAGI